jgi:hypothetical protein
VPQANVEVFPRQLSILERFREAVYGEGDSDIPKVKEMISYVAKHRDLSSLSLVAALPVLGQLLEVSSTTNSTKPRLTVPYPIPSIDSTREDQE